MSVMKWQTISTGPEDTETIGAAIGRLIKGGEVIELRSDLGGGKTVFVRGVARGLGSSDKVLSPTFTINRIYNAPGLEIQHFDFYRLPEPGLVSEQLEESLQDPKVITLVEWSNLVEGVLPHERLIVTLKPTPNAGDERLIEITYPPAKAAVIKKLQTALAEVRP